MKLPDGIVIFGFLSTAFGIVSKFFAWTGTEYIVLAFAVSGASFLSAVYLRMRSASEKLEDSAKKMKEDLQNFTAEVLPSYDLRRHLQYHFTLLKQLRDSGIGLQSMAGEELFGKYLHLRFDGHIDQDLRKCVEELNRMEMTLENPDYNGFHEFIRLFWESAPERSVIRSTSIVNPSDFWIRAAAYIQSQTNLIQQRHVAIYRYFLIAGDRPARPEDHFDALRQNIQAGIRTRVTLFRDMPQAEATQCWHDIGLIEGHMLAENTMDNQGNITQVSCYINSPTNEHHLRSAQALFTGLERNLQTIRSEDFNSPNLFLNAIVERYKAVTAVTP